MSKSDTKSLNNIVEEFETALSGVLSEDDFDVILKIVNNVGEGESEKAFEMIRQLINKEG